MHFLFFSQRNPKPVGDLQRFFSKTSFSEGLALQNLDFYWQIYRFYTPIDFVVHSEEIKLFESFLTDDVALLSLANVRLGQFV